MRRQKTAFYSFRWQRLKSQLCSNYKQIRQPGKTSTPRLKRGVSVNQRKAARPRDIARKRVVALKTGTCLGQ